MALKASNEGIWDWDVSGGGIYYSNRLLGFLGYGRIGAPNLFARPGEHVHPDDLDHFSKKLERVVNRGGKLFAEEARIRTKEGEWKWFRIRGLPERNEDGELVRLVGSMIDISKRRFAEEALLEERQRIDLVLDRVPINVYFKDRDSRFMRANQATVDRMAGGKLDDLLGKTDADFLVPELAAASRATEVRIMESGEGQEERLEKERWLDGRETWGLVTKWVWRALNGELLGTFGLTHDVTELVQAEHDLQQLADELKAVYREASEERSLLRLVIDNIPVFVYFKDQNSQFVLVNQGMAQLVNEESAEKVAGKHDRDYFDDELVQAAVRDEQKIMESGEPLVRKLEKISWKDDRVTWSVSSKYPWYAPDGSLRGTFGVSSDVTQLVETRQKLEKMTRVLGGQKEALEEQLELAREVQQAAFPESIRGLGGEKGMKAMFFHHCYQPASQLAGDFFEVIELDQNRAGFLVCDVMGHGVRSALIVSMLRGLIEKQRESLGDRPGLFLSGLNEGLCHLLERTNQLIFATAVYGMVDVAKGELRVSSAGHPDSLLMKGGKVAPMGLGQIQGPALGMMPDFEFAEIILGVHEFERAWFFTDGVFEVLGREGLEFGRGRMMATLEEAGSLEESIERLVETAGKFSRTGVFDDDVCVLGLDLQGG